MKVVQVYFASEVSVTLPNAYDALLAGGIEGYRVLAVTNILGLTVSGVLYEGSQMKKALIPPGAVFSARPGVDGGVVTLLAVFARGVNLAEATVGLSQPECGVHGRAANESGSLSYEVTLTPLLPPGSAANPEARIMLGSSSLPDDTVLEVRQTSAPGEVGTLIASLTPSDQYIDSLDQRTAILRGAWSGGFGGSAFTLTLRRTGGGALPSLPVAALRAVGTYAGYVPGMVVGAQGDVTARRDTGSGLAAWTACPQFMLGKFPPRLLSGVGASAVRPAAWPTNLPWFDTELGKPLWRRPDGVWVDALGTAT